MSASGAIIVNRRTFLGAGLGVAFGSRLLACTARGEFETAADVLARAASSGQVAAAAICVRHGGREFARSFGAAKSVDDIFLLASISKTISAAALMTLYDRGKFRLDDPVRKHLEEFKGDGRDRVTIRQLLTHTSGLPDQLSQNARLRARHAGLPEFVAGAVRTPLLFAPGTRYGYSSMGILLASEIASRLGDMPFATLVDKAVYAPLRLKHSAMGLGRFERKAVMQCQVEKAAPESGAGDPTTKNWDWNSEYWRKLGVPWGGAHGSARDVARFLGDFLRPGGKMLEPETSRTMIANQNPAGLRPRGLGFDLGRGLGGPRCSPSTFGHTGSTGTLCWADPATDTICVVLTTLPGRAANPHPRTVASNRVAEAVHRAEPH